MTDEIIILQFIRNTKYFTKMRDLLVRCVYDEVCEKKKQEEITGARLVKMTRVTSDEKGTGRVLIKREREREREEKS